MNGDFSSYLMELIEKSGKKNREIYTRAGITRQAFSKIYSGKVTPTKNSVCALAVALKLDLETANALLERAGMVLSKSEPFDMVIQYFLETKNYDIALVNEALFLNDLPQLGSH